MKVTLAIATYQRVDYIERMSASLLASVDISRVSVRVYDDASPGLTEEQLSAYFPYAEEIVKRPRNLKADANMAQIFEDFLNTGDDLLLLADSDLIYRPGWLDVALSVLPETDGVLSLYNSRLHPVQLLCEGKAYNLKKDLGAAGTLMTRERVCDIVDAEMPPVAFDWAWSNLFISRGIRLCCLQESYIQHIGVIGQNNHGSVADFDFALNFYPSNRVNEEIVSTFLLEIAQEQARYLNYLGARNILDSRAYDLKMRSLGLRNQGLSYLHCLRIRARAVLYRILQIIS